MDKKYNWWTDPKNKEQVDLISWWNHEKNKTYFDFPVSVVNEGEYYTATFNEETKNLLGDLLNGCASAKTKEDAIKKLFKLVQFGNEYSEECRLNYQRWVPFRKGDWKKNGGTWFSVFGIHVYFRRGFGMKGGFYIPFTKLNISTSNDWVIYKTWKLNRENNA